MLPKEGTMRLAFAAIMCFGMCGMQNAARATPSFDTSNKVASAVNAAGTGWVCVLKDTSNIYCGWITQGGQFQWCNTATPIPNGYAAYNGNSGVYLVPGYSDANNGDVLEAVYLTTYHAADSTYYLMRLRITDNRMTNCLYDNTPWAAPYIIGKDHPDIGPKLALARGNANDKFLHVFAVVPSSDTTGAAGSLLGAKVSDFGSGTTLTWEYNSGSTGIVNHLFDPGTLTSPTTLAAVTSSQTGDPIVALRDNSTYQFAGAFLLNGWNYLASGGALTGVGSPTVAGGIAGAAVQTQTSGNTTKADSFFVVGSDGHLYESKVTCTGLCGAATFAFTSPKDWSNSGTSIDGNTDSLAASWYVDANSKTWAVAYERDSDTSAHSVQTDDVGLNGSSWSGNLINAQYSWPTNYSFKGNWALVRITGMSNQDNVAGACTDGGAASKICGLQRSFGQSNYSWQTY